MSNWWNLRFQNHIEEKIGKKLFGMACEEARKMNAEKKGL